MCKRSTSALSLTIVLMWGILSNVPIDRAHANLTVEGTAPINSWVMELTDAPVRPWETGFAYDPTAGAVVYHAGHVDGATPYERYPQSGYTHLYDVAAGVFRESHAPSRPQRRCIVELSYLDSIDRIATVHGGTSHGSWPIGDVSRDGTTIAYSDPVGPWLYDSATDTWDDARTLLPRWSRQAHAQLAYDASSDIMYSLTPSGLAMYHPLQNRVGYAALPQALQGRISYAIAADPVNRKLVVFGGTGPRGWTWVSDMPRNEAYDTYVHNDTWIFDPLAKTWEEVNSAVRPPKGMPLYDHTRLPMVYHPPSGTMLLLQNPIDAATLDVASWPATELWSFDVATRSWTKVPTENNPGYVGLMVYASGEDQLVMLGGALDNGQPSQSRHLYTIRVQVPDRQIRSAPAHDGRVSATPTASGFTIDWPALPDTGYWIERALVGFGAGAYEVINSTPVVGGSYADDSVVLGKRYAYRVRTDEPEARASLPVFTGPGVAKNLQVSVQNAGRIELAWEAPSAASDVSYRVYRFTAPPNWSADELLTPVPLHQTSFVDTTANLSDGAIRGYYVVAIDGHGAASGPSPVRYTAPEAPLQFHAAPVEGDPTVIDLSWTVPPEVNVISYNIYHVDYHLNTHGASAEETAAWMNAWAKVNDAPLTGTQLRFRIPPASQDKPHQYFRIRAVNVLGQEGFHSDIVSATDPRFRPAVEPVHVAPAVVLTAPEDGSAFMDGASITLGAEVSNDANGSVSEVQFFANDTLLGRSTAAPYSLNWIPPAAGSYKLMATAVDTVDGDANSAPIAINVTEASNSVTLILQDGLDGYSGTRDTYISRHHLKHSFGSRTNLRDRSPGLQVLIDFAIFQSEGGPVPDGAIIEAATLSLYKSGAYDHSYRLSRLLVDWSEDAATWSQRLVSELWSVLGAEGVGTDIAFDPDAEASIGWEPGWLSFEVTAAMQARSSGAVHYGWTLDSLGGNFNIKDFVSRESSDSSLRPKLTITYR